MKERRYLALLRGINVGGKNPVRMADLRTCFEELGFADVATYIQSGNVVFRADIASREALTAEIERALAERFGYDARVVVVADGQLRQVVEDAPAGFGEQPAAYRYDVIFFRTPLTPAAAIDQVPTREGVDTVHLGKDVLYFSRLIARATQSRLSRIVRLPSYQDMTIRNWNTTTKLLALMDSR